MPGKTAALSLKLHSDLVVLTPNIRQTRLDPRGSSSAASEHGQPRHDTNLRGQVTLSLPKEARFSRITVELKGRQEITVKQVYHAYDVLRRMVELDTGEGILQAGNHQFAFEFVIPANAAPLEDCQHGKTYYKVTATAYAAGAFHADLTAEERVGLITNHSEDDSLEPSFNADTKIANEHLGIVAINLSSQSLIIPGYLRISVDIAETTHEVRLEEIRVSLLQSWSLQSLQEESRNQEIPAVQIPLWSWRDTREASLEATTCTSSSSAPLRSQGGLIATGSSFSLDKRIVFPENDVIRASTSMHSRTGLKASHKLQVEISYTLLPSAISTTGDERKSRIVKMTTPAILSMCPCAVEALQLPAYGITAEMQILHQRACDQRAKACTFGNTVDDGRFRLMENLLAESVFT